MSMEAHSVVVNRNIHLHSPVQTFTSYKTDRLSNYRISCCNVGEYWRNDWASIPFTASKARHT